MGSSSDSLMLLDAALSKVHQIKSNVSAALCSCPDVADKEPSAANQALECLERAQQHIQQLQQLAPHIHQLAAAVAQQQPGSTSSGQDNSSWISAVQQQARQCSEELLQQLQAVIASAQGTGLRSLLPKQQRHQYGHVPWMVLLERIGTAVPHLKLYLFKSSTNQLMYSQDKPQPLNWEALVKYSSWVDEVRVVWPGVFAGSIALAAPGRLDPVRVCVDCFDKASSVDAWSSSKHQVFKRISYLAVRALQHFHHLEAAAQLLEPKHNQYDLADIAAAVAAAAATTYRAALDAAAADAAADAAANPRNEVFAKQAAKKAAEAREVEANARAAAVEATEVAERYGDTCSSRGAGCRPLAAGTALECLLLWLSCYEDLFSRPCSVSGKVIAWEPATAIPLPPVLRPYWLTLDQLIEAAATNKSKRRAYHTHLAPWPPGEQQAAAQAQQQQQQQRQRLQPPDGQRQTAEAAAVAGMLSQQQQAQQQQQQQQLGESAGRSSDVQNGGAFVFDGNVWAAVPALTDEQLMAQLHDIMAQS